MGKNAPTSFEDADDEVARYRRFGPDGALLVSVTGEIGMKELKQRVHQVLTSQMARIKTEKGEHGDQERSSSAAGN